MTETDHEHDGDEGSITPLADALADEALEEDYEAEQDEQAASGAQDEQQAQAAPTGPTSQKELDAIGRKLDAETKRHTERVSTILGDMALNLNQCPLCRPDIPGWTFPDDLQNLAPEQLSVLRTIVGMPDASAYKASDWTRECERCDGLGSVASGSKKPGNELVDCAGCSGSGWVTIPSEPNGAVVLPLAPPPAVTGPTVYGNEDPLIATARATLQAKGFTVVAPLNVTGGTS